MITLLHQKTKQLSELLLEGAAVLTAYAEGDYAFDHKTVDLLEKAHRYYTEAQQPDHVAKISTCQADVVTLSRGYHPQTFQKIEREKRSIRTTQTYRTVQQLLLILDEDYLKVQAKLDASEELIKQLVLNVLQMQLLDEATLRNRQSQEDLENIWKRIGQEPNLNLFQKKIILSSSLTDALILLDKVLGELL
jgi:hypothetical protein